MASEKRPAFAPFMQGSPLSRRWPDKRPQNEDGKRARRAARFAVCVHCGLDLNNHGIGFASMRAALRYHGAVDRAVPERQSLLIGINPHDSLNLWCVAKSCHYEPRRPPTSSYATATGQDFVRDSKKRVFDGAGGRGPSFLRPVS